MQSIIDGRLFQQAHRLALSGHPVLMILEGEEADLQQSNMSWESIQGSLVTVSLFFPYSSPAYAGPEADGANVPLRCQQYRSVTTDALARHGRRPKRKAALQSHILQGLPDIGPKRARVLLERFGTVEEVMKASVEQLTGIEGIGECRAQKIRWAVEDTTVGHAEELALADSSGMVKIAP